MRRLATAAIAALTLAGCSVTITDGVDEARECELLGGRWIKSSQGSSAVCIDKSALIDIDTQDTQP